MPVDLLKHKVVRGLAWAGLENWSRQLLGFVTFAFLARLVGPEAFGLVALAMVYVALIEIFVTQGFGTAIIQRKELEKGHIDSAFWMSMAMAGGLCLASLALAGWVASLFDEPRLAPVLRCMSLSLLLIGLGSIPVALLTRQMAFKSLAGRSLAATLSGATVGLSMAWNGWGVWSLVGQQLASATAGTAVVWWAAAWRPAFEVSGRHLRDLYGFALSIVGNNLLWFGSQRADHSLVGYSFGAAALGPYALAGRSIQLLMDAVAAPVQAVALPAFSRMQDQSRRLRDAFHESSEIISMIAFPAFAGLIALAPEVVSVMLGLEWMGAVPIFQALAVYGALRVVLSLGHPLMLAVKRPGVYLLLFLFHTVLTLAFCLVAAFWSPLAIAWALTMALSVYSAIFLVVCRRMTGISLKRLLGGFAAPLAASLIMFGVLAAFKGFVPEGLPSVLALTAFIALGAAVYGLSLFLFRPSLVRRAVHLALSRFQSAGSSAQR